MSSRLLDRHRAVVKLLSSALAGFSLALPLGAGSAPFLPVPTQKRRALVCLGGPCYNAGAGLRWGHVRNAQKRLALARAGGGTVSAKTSCLGHCALAPVVHVYPEGHCAGSADTPRATEL